MQYLLVIFVLVVFGILWGIGGLTFGLTMRYLGMSLGMAMALGLRNDQLDLQVKFEREEKREAMRLTFPTL